MSYKCIFIDRDGTIITEPNEFFQIDSINKFMLEPDVIPSLLALQKYGYSLIIITNQDGLGTASFHQEHFDNPHHMMMQMITSQGISIKDILICPHKRKDHCSCRKPKKNMLKSYLSPGIMNLANSYVIGDRNSDVQLAAHMGIQGILYQRETFGWKNITQKLTNINRYAHVNRVTKETQINVKVWLDKEGGSHINTGIYFFNHMLEQMATHGGFRMDIQVHGDLYIDDHHTVEDTALTLGEALKKALGEKIGISRFGFLLPMDECIARCTIDLSGRPYLKYKVPFHYQRVGDLSTAMVEHFFRSLSYTLGCTLHLKNKGKNDHHRVESLFKVFGRTFRKAIRMDGNHLPSSKGVL